MHLPDPVFPPLLTGHDVKAPERPFEVACRRAASGGLGAGDVVWARNVARAEMALVLEPEVPRRQALQMLPLWQVAVCDSLGALLPPKVPLHIRWPGVLLVDGGIAGSTVAAMSRCSPDEVPDRLVLGFEIALSRTGRDVEPGTTAHTTVLAEEGAADLDRTRILQSLAAHALTWIDLWQDEGFRTVHESWIGRVEGYGADDAVVTAGPADRPVAIRGRILGLDDEMRLMMREQGGTTRTVSFEDALRGIDAPEAGR